MLPRRLPLDIAHYMIDDAMAERNICRRDRLPLVAVVDVCGEMIDANPAAFDPLARRLRASA